MDMSKYMGIFRAESEKYIKELSDSLLALETDPENAEQMNTIISCSSYIQRHGCNYGIQSKLLS